MLGHRKTVDWFSSDNWLTVGKASKFELIKVNILQLLKTQTFYYNNTDH